MQSATSSTLFHRPALGALLIILCLWMAGNARAAPNLAGAEYFIDPTPWVLPHLAGTRLCDNDPGLGNGTPLPPTDGTWNAVIEAVSLADVDPSQLPPGVHDLCVRFKDSSGVWGLTRFIHFTSGRGLAACEYYIGTDPGPGKGKLLPAEDGKFNTNLENLKSAAIAVTGLTLGVHSIGARCRDEWGRWGTSQAATVNVIHIPAPVLTRADPGDKQVTLKWNAVSAATSYYIYQGTTAGRESTQPVANPNPGTVTSTIINGLTNGTTYFFKMRARNSADTSVLSNEKSARPTATLPDFTVIPISLFPASPAPSGTFSARVKISNLGRVSSDGRQLAIWGNQPTVQVCNAAADKLVAVGTLAAGASTILTVDGLTAGGDGVKTLRVFVDSTCAIAELNNNNQSTLAYRVGAAPAPDFVVTDMTLNPDPPTAMGSFNATVTVKNQGTLAGNAGYLDVWANQSVAQSCGAVGTNFTTIGTLAAGASKTITLKLPVGSAGTKTLRAFIDSWCATRESNEGNNQLTKTYTVK